MNVQFGSSYREFRKPSVREIGVLLYIVAFTQSYSINLDN